MKKEEKDVDCRCATKKKGGDEVDIEHGHFYFEYCDERILNIMIDV